MTTRLVILFAVAFVGIGLGLIGRWLIGRRVRSAFGADPADALSPGLWIITAPYCASCSHLRRRLDSWQPKVRYQVVDITEHPDLVRTLDIRTAPTLMAISESRHTRRLHGNITDPQLAAAIDIART